MRVALISDIHGNAAALEAVLATIAQGQVDQVICLGDVLTGGPQPEQVVNLLRGAQPVLVLGNGDRRLLNPVSPEGLSEHARDLIDTETWIRQLLPAEDLAWLRQATLVYQTQIGGKQLLCCHGSPRSVNETLLPWHSDDQLAEALQGYQFDVLAAGHTHTAMLRKFGRSVLVNPGAVGWSPGGSGWSAGEGPIAKYALLSVDDGRESIEFRSLTYDIAPAIEHALASGMPHADSWVGTWGK